jgi:uncharacterized membrane protein YfcA
VPIAVLAAKMTVQDAAAFAAAVSAFGALPSLADALGAEHPLQPGERPSVDYPALALGMPALLLGVKLGTLFNKAAPAYLLTLLLVVLYGWGAIDLSLSYWRLLKRERERDALLKRLEQRLDRAATLEQALSSGKESAELSDAALWAEDAEGELAGASLPPAAALARRAQAPLLVPADKALHAERLALQRDLARLQEISAEILRREARGVHQGALDRTVDADLLAAFRARERARAASAAAAATAATDKPTQKPASSNLPPSSAQAVDGGSPTAAAPAARARGDSFYSTSSPAQNKDAANKAAAPIPLDALARQLLATAHEHKRRAHIRRVHESALADERYRQHAASVAAESSGRRRLSTAAASSAHRLASLRSAVSVTGFRVPAGGGGLRGGAVAAPPSSSAPSSAAAAGGGRLASFLRGAGASFVGGRSGLRGLSPVRGGSSPVRGTSPARGGSPIGSVLATAGSGPSRALRSSNDVAAATGAPPTALGGGRGGPPLARSASDLLAARSSPWLLTPQQQKLGGSKDGGGGDGDVERAGGGRDQTAAARPENDARSADDKGCWIVDEADEHEKEGEQASPDQASSSLSSFFARRRDGFSRWWRLLPKFEAAIILFSFCIFLAFTLGPELVYHAYPCSPASLGWRSVFAGLMIAITFVVVVVVLRRHRAADEAAAATANDDDGADKAAKEVDPADPAADNSDLHLAHGRHEAGLALSPVLAALVPPCALSVGALGASVGASGSVIVQPIGLRLGVHPQIVSATSKILLFVSTAASSLSLTLAGRMNGSYALAYGLVTLGLTPPGQWAADALVKKHGRPSLIVLVNILRYVLGVVLLVVVVLVPALDAVVEGSPEAHFVSPC